MIRQIANMIEEGRTHGRRQCVIVGTDVAVIILREAFFRPIQDGLVFTEAEDELFRISGIPVKLRHHAVSGNALLVSAKSVPERHCCDQTALQTVLICLNRGGRS